MSRPINVSGSVKLIPNTYTNTGSYNFTHQTINNAYSDADSTSSNRMTLQRSNQSTRTSEIYYEFDKSSLANIPSNATINYITANVKYYVSNTTYVTEVSMQLCSNTTKKGSAITNKPTNGTKYAITAGTWTREELNNIRLYISGTHNKSNNNGYIYFYGADVTITYSVSDTEYEITSTLGTNEVSSISPVGQTWVAEGNDYELSIYVDDIDSINVTDNGNDVTSQLVQVIPTEGSNTFNGIPSSVDSINSTYDSIYEGSLSNGVASHTNTTRVCVYANETANSISKLIYNFDCSSIPVDAIITNVSCIASAACYSNGQYFNTRVLQLYSGNTAKGSPTTITGTGNTRTEHTINGGSLWTRNELNDINIVIYIQRGNNTTQASFSFWGATLTVEYTLPSTPYYKYTLTNVNDDHIINIVDAIIEIPEEDPQYDYYNLTISSINATTDPGRGTIRIVEGSNQTITIIPSDPQLTLALDNGVDITSQLQGGVPNNTYDVTTKVSGATYGFNLNTSTGYYVSTNTGVSKSASVARLNLHLESSCLVTIQYINYAEENYDYGMFGKLDTAVATDGLTASSGSSSPSDSTANYQLAMASNSAYAQTITYEVSAGEHFIDIKYGKDDASDSNNDTLQWKVLNIEATGTSGNYTYTLSNISIDHSLIFVFGNVTYYFANSSGTNAKLYPNGSMVQLPGDNYRLVIVPDDYSYVVTVKDNNVDVTSSVQRKEEEITKNGETITVVNYIYLLSNIQTTHNIVVECRPDQTLFIKVNGSFVQVSAVYKKVNGSWIEQNDYENLFDNSKIYIKN